MKIKYNIFFIFFLVSFFAADLSARKNVINGELKNDNRAAAILKKSAADCAAPTATAVLSVNNVKTTLQNGGDMWWDLVGMPKYEVPKITDDGQSKHSLFAGSIWIGGL